MEVSTIDAAVYNKTGFLLGCKKYYKPSFCQKLKIPVSFNMLSDTLSRTKKQGELKKYESLLKLNYCEFLSIRDKITLWKIEYIKHCKEEENVNSYR